MPRMRRPRTQQEALAWIKEAGETLTKRQVDILKQMAAHLDDDGDDDGELIYERGVAFLGDVRIAAGTVNAFLRACVIRLESGEVGRGLERYKINGTGRGVVLRWRIAELLDMVNYRARARGGATTPTSEEITVDELRELCRLIAISEATKVGKILYEAQARVRRSNNASAKRRG